MVTKLIFGNTVADGTTRNTAKFKKDHQLGLIIIFSSTEDN